MTAADMREWWVVFVGEDEKVAVEQVPARTAQLAAKIVIGYRDVAGVLVLASEPDYVFLGRCGKCQAMIQEGDVVSSRGAELRCEACP